MTHTPDFGAESRRRFFVPDRRKSTEEYATDRRRSAPTGARSVWHTVQKSAPIFGARRRNLDCVLSA